MRYQTTFSGTEALRSRSYLPITLLADERSLREKSLRTKAFAGTLGARE